MKNKKVLTVAAVLLAVIAGGSLVFGLGGEKREIPSAGGAPSGTNHPVENRKGADEAGKPEEKVPGNFSEWVELGNRYFDTGQPANAVYAYGKALELNPNDPDVLTDQGVSCRQIGWYDKAVANFEKAQQIDPKHEQSLVNLGILYAIELKQPDKALKAWHRFLEINPSSPGSQQVRLWAEQLKATGELH
ncbi:MAG: tetratricopeptide repeat protein [Geobacter sp.]|nr:tetratricopeptide repeat protein [Geobacter sp.]